MLMKLKLTKFNVGYKPADLDEPSETFVTEYWHNKCNGSQIKHGVKHLKCFQIWNKNVFRWHSIL